MAVPIVLDLVVHAFHGVLLGIGRAVAEADLVGLLLGGEHPLLLVLKVLLRRCCCWKICAASEMQS